MSLGRRTFHTGELLRCVYIEWSRIYGFTMPNIVPHHFKQAQFQPKDIIHSMLTPALPRGRSVWTRWMSRKKNVPIAAFSPDTQIGKDEETSIFVVVFSIFEVVKGGDDRACRAASFSILRKLIRSVTNTFK